MYPSNPTSSRSGICILRIIHNTYYICTYIAVHVPKSRRPDRLVGLKYFNNSTLTWMPFFEFDVIQMLLLVVVFFGRLE